MAGFYPDVPGRHFMYDRDGSVGFKLSGNKTGALTALSDSELINMNSEYPVVPTVIGAESTYSHGIVFPELRDISGILVNSPAGVNEIETSVDTTNGVDGTWVQRFAALANQTGQAPSFRTDIEEVSWTGIKAVRITHTYGGDQHCYALHIYGEISAGEIPDRLRFWHPTLDEELAAAALDFGDRPRSSYLVKTFRVKNNSATFTANDIVVSREALYDPSPEILPSIAFDNAGSGYDDSQNIGDLAPGAISGVISVQLVLDPDARLGLSRQRVIASADSWA